MINNLLYKKQLHLVEILPSINVRIVPGLVQYIFLFHISSLLKLESFNTGVE